MSQVVDVTLVCIYDLVRSSRVALNSGRGEVDEVLHPGYLANKTAIEYSVRVLLDMGIGYAPTKIELISFEPSRAADYAP